MGFYCIDPPCKNQARAGKTAIEDKNEAETGVGFAVGFLDGLFSDAWTDSLFDICLSFGRTILGTTRLIFFILENFR